MTEALKEWSGVIEMLVVGIGVVVALLTYRRDAKLRRSEWLYRLYQQFYENDRFNPIRALVDYEPEQEIKQLTADISNNEGTDLHEAFVDYLNFFEFIAIQLKNRNLRQDEVLDMFDYYIRRLGDHDFILAYIKKFGYENLDALLSTMTKSK